MMLVVTVHPVPKSSVAAGIFVSAFGASCSFLLWAYKAHYGRVLRSMVLLAVSFFFFFFSGYSGGGAALCVFGYVCVTVNANPAS